MSDPDFLTVDDVNAIHREQLDTFGGSDGVIDQGNLESAVHQAQNVWAYYAGADLYDLAAAYAF